MAQGVEDGSIEEKSHPLLKVDLSELRARIARARAMDLRDLTDDQVFSRIARLADGYTKRRDTLITNMVFRARRHEHASPFSQASEVWHPPASVVKRGRFNAAGEPAFYVANRFHAAIFEMRPRLGDLFTVLAVHRRDPSGDIRCISVGMSRCQAPEVAVGGRHMHWDQPHLPDQKLPAGVAARWSAIDNYLGDISLAICPPGAEEWFYKPTNALSRLFATIPGIEALQYPSVAVDLNAVNLRLTTEKADELFEPGEAGMVEVLDHRNDLPGLPPLASGYFQMRLVARTSKIGPNGLMQWRPFNPNDHIPPYVDGSPRFSTP